MSTPIQEPKKCFIVSPMGDSTPHGIGIAVDKWIRKALEEMNIEASETEPIEAGTRDFGNITRAIESADFVIADVSDANPNVMYELGFAHALRKPTLLLHASNTKLNLPAELRGYHFAIYEPDDLKGFDSKLRSSVKRVLQYRRR